MQEPPTEREARSFGLTLEEASGPPVDVWPDLWEVVNVFAAMETQWRRAGMTGVVTGLDYTALPVVLRMLEVKRANWRQVFDDIRVMEGAAIEHAVRQLNK